VHHDFLDRWSRLDSPVHRLPSGLKLGLALGAVIAAVAAPIRLPWAFALLALLLAATAAASRIPPSFLGRRLLLLEPFVLGVAALSAFQPGGRLVVLSIVVKSTLCLATMVLLTNTTPFSELLRVLRRMGTPAILVTVLALMYRYLFVLVDEAQRMSRARRSRTFDGRRSRAWRDLAGLAGQLFVRSSERAERIYAAMWARGWD
jgi:cobalt/nickel transport system permease protein